MRYIRYANDWGFVCACCFRVLVLQLSAQSNAKTTNGSISATTTTAAAAASAKATQPLSLLSSSNSSPPTFASGTVAARYSTPASQQSVIDLTAADESPTRKKQSPKAESMEPIGEFDYVERRNSDSDNNNCRSRYAVANPWKRRALEAPIGDASACRSRSCLDD